MRKLLLAASTALAVAMPMLIAGGAHAAPLVAISPEALPGASLVQKTSFTSTAAGIIAFISMAGMALATTGAATLGAADTAGRNGSVLAAPSHDLLVIRSV